MTNLSLILVTSLVMAFLGMVILYIRLSKKLELKEKYHSNLLKKFENTLNEKDKLKYEYDQYVIETDLNLKELVSKKKSIQEELQDQLKVHDEELEELNTLAEAKLERTIKAYEEKLTEAENNMNEYEKTFAKIDSNIRLSDNKIKEIDAKGTFKSDDEVGFFFEGLKQIQENLNALKMYKS